MGVFDHRPDGSWLWRFVVWKRDLIWMFLWVFFKEILRMQNHILPVPSLRRDYIGFHHANRWCRMLLLHGRGFVSSKHVWSCTELRESIRLAVEFFKFRIETSISGTVSQVLIFVDNPTEGLAFRSNIFRIVCLSKLFSGMWFYVIRCCILFRRHHLLFLCIRFRSGVVTVTVTNTTQHVQERKDIGPTFRSNS